MKKQLSLALMLVVVLSSQAQLNWNAKEAGLQLSLIPLTALHSTETTIIGLSLNIWGQNPQHGVALGIVNGSTGESSGFSLGALLNYADAYTGVHWGTINVSKSRFNGWQLGVFNYTGGEGKGLQSGAINIARDFNGLQLGAINYTDRLHGLQIGAINIVTKNPWFSDPNHCAPLFPVVNWSF